jgi:hypothetical protein
MFAMGRRVVEFQAALCAADETMGQPKELNEVIKTMGQVWSGARPPSIVILATRIHLEQLTLTPTLEELWKDAGAEDFRIPLGLDYETLRPVGFNLLTDGNLFLVVGPSQRGKTTALQTFAQSCLEHMSDKVEVTVVDALGSGLAKTRYRTDSIAVVTNSDQFGKLTQKLLGIIGNRKQQVEKQKQLPTFDPRQVVSQFKRYIVLIDDLPLTLEQFKEHVSSFQNIMDQLDQAGITLVVSCGYPLQPGTNALVRRFTTNGVGLALSPDALEAFNARPLQRFSVPLPVGRGYLQTPSWQRRLQTSLPLS